jgi:hypothetical protein
MSILATHVCFQGLVPYAVTDVCIPDFIFYDWNKRSSNQDDEDEAVCGCLVKALLDPSAYISVVCRKQLLFVEFGLGSVSSPTVVSG